MHYFTISRVVLAFHKKFSCLFLQLFPSFFHKIFCICFPSFFPCPLKFLFMFLYHVFTSL